MDGLLIVGGIMSNGLAFWTKVERRETERRLRRGEIRMTWQNALPRGFSTAYASRRSACWGWC